MQREYSCHHHIRQSNAQQREDSFKVKENTGSRTKQHLEPWKNLGKTIRRWVTRTAWGAVWTEYSNNQWGKFEKFMILQCRTHDDSRRLDFHLSKTYPLLFLHSFQIPDPASPQDLPLVSVGSVQLLQNTCFLQGKRKEFRDHEVLITLRFSFSFFH